MSLTKVVFVAECSHSWLRIRYNNLLLLNGNKQVIDGVNNTIHIREKKMVKQF